MKKKDNLENFQNVKMDYGNITKEEIEKWIATSRGVILLLKDRNSDKHQRVYKEFTEDLEELLNYGRISQAEYNDIIETL